MLEAVKDVFLVVFFFFAVEAMRAALRQVIVKRQGGAVSVLGTFSDSRVFWQGGTTNCPLEMSHTVDHLDLKS